MDEFEKRLEEIRSMPTCEPCDGEECPYHALCECLGHPEGRADD